MSECMQTDRKRIQVLLSTYNGAPYLREQLDSFLYQENFRHIKVLIRDDGSTDETPDILQEYSLKSGFEVVVGENIGVNASYRWLLQHSDPYCDYYAFSDQDDVWLQNKMSLSEQKLDQYGNREKPLLFFTLSQISDSDLAFLGISMFPSRGGSFYNAMVQNVCPGHTQVFNRSLRELLLQSPAIGIQVFDWWNYLLASSAGEILFEPVATVLHRQHGKNAVGYELRFFSKLCRRLKRLSTQDSSALSVQLKVFAQTYSEIIPMEHYVEINRFLDSQGTILGRLNYILKSKFYRQSLLDTYAVKLLYVIGKYKISG